MHWTKAESIIKLLLEDPSQLRTLSFEVAEQLVTDRITSLLKVYHPDKGHYKNHDKFLELGETRAFIDKYSFKTIFEALQLAPSARSKDRTQILEAKVKKLQEGVKISITNLVEGFESGSYHYGLSDNAPTKFVLLTNPHQSYSAKSIDLESALRDPSLDHYFKLIIERSAKKQIPLLKSKINDYENHIQQQEMLRSSQLESLKFFNPLYDAIAEKSLSKLKTKLDEIINYANTYPDELQNKTVPNLKHIKRLMHSYIFSQAHIKTKLAEATTTIEEIKELQNLANTHQNIDSLAKELALKNTAFAQTLNEYISNTQNTPKTSNTPTTKSKSSEIKIYETVLNKIKSKLNTTEQIANTLSNSICSEDSFIDTVKAELDKKKKSYLHTIKYLDDKIKSFDSKILETLCKIDEYANLVLTTSSVRDYLYLQPDILDAVGKEISLKGTIEEKKMMKARTYLQKNSFGNSNPRYSALATLYIDEHLSIHYKTLPSLTSKFPNKQEYTKTNKKILGIINTSILNAQGIPNQQSNMISTSESYTINDSVLNPALIKQLVFFENLFNSIEQNHINGNYGLISVEFKNSKPLYRFEGVIASDFFTSLQTAKTKPD
ncbi:MAG: hypothetical protein WC758_01085 [Candidatus Woesearchaeota archaeon]|jgi:hypothetical protein